MQEARRVVWRDYLLLLGIANAILHVNVTTSAIPRMVCLFNAIMVIFLQTQQI